jgi:hypothetical protein
VVFVKKEKNKGGRPRKEDVERRKAEQEFRDGLIAQLVARKADTPFFVEQVNEILYLREQLRQLKHLVANNGIVVSELTRSGNARVSINSCLREIRETEKSILLILKELKITTDNIIPEDQEDDL